MPNATVNTDFGEPIQLKSLEGAFVKVRPLSYGKKLDRLDNASKMYMEMDRDDARGRSRKGADEDESIKAFIESMQSWARAFDFAYCIGDHNLEDAKGTKLDFSNAMTLEILDPRVGTELGEILDALNGDNEDDLADFIKQHTSSSQAESEASSPLSQTENTG